MATATAPASLIDTSSPPVVVSNAATATAPIVIVTPASSGPPDLAGRVFAAAMHLAGARDERRAAMGSSPSSPLAGTASVVAPTDPTRPPPSAAPTIDLTDHHWPAQMVEHIEALRDGADAGNTRVRFAPNALGAVELHVRHDGDQIHLHLTAADPATRALLGEARPELARLASERGVRLGDTSVGSGEDQSRRPPAAPARFAAAPRAASADVTDATTDIRIA